jgi:hypothetical protein
MPLTLTTPPETEPVTLAEAKAFANDEDALIQATGRQLISATYQFTALLPPRRDLPRYRPAGAARMSDSTRRWSRRPFRRSAVRVRNRTAALPNREFGV